MSNVSLIDFWETVNSKHRHPAYRNMRFGQIAFSTLHRLRPELAAMIQGGDRDPYYVEDHITSPKFLRFCDFLIDNWKQ